MEVAPTSIPGVVVVSPARLSDARGWFSRTFDAGLFGELGFVGPIVQENQSRSARGVLRGLHVRTDLAESKTVRVLSGALHDVVVDLRPWSSTFLKHVALDLSAEESAVLVVPPGCAHGFVALRDDTQVLYQVTAHFEPELDKTIAWNDPQLAITWPIASPTLSDRDRRAPRIADVASRLPVWFGATAPPM